MGPGTVTASGNQANQLKTAASGIAKPTGMAPRATQNPGGMARGTTDLRREGMGAKERPAGTGGGAGGRRMAQGEPVRDPRRQPARSSTVGGVPTSRTRPGPDGQPEGRAAPGQRDIEGVSGRITGLLRDGSKYIEQARGRASRAANKRGLMNSSIAAGAGEAAAVDAALPIAQGDAQLAAGERALESQEFQQARSLRVQQLMQERGLDHDSAERQADRELQETLQGRGFEHDVGMQGRDISSREMMQERDLRVRQLMQDKGLTHDEAQRQADRELQDLMQTRGFVHDASERGKDRTLSEVMQGRDIDSRELMQSKELRVRQLMQERGLSHDAAQRQADRELSDLMQTRQIASTERVAEANRNLQDTINQRNIRSQELMQTRGLSHDAAQKQAQREMQSEIAAASRAVERESLAASKDIAVMNAQSRNYGVYQGAMDRINANTETPAEERAEQRKQVQQSFDVATSVTQQVTGKSFSWPTYGG